MVIEPPRRKGRDMNYIARYMRDMKSALRKVLLLTSMVLLLFGIAGMAYSIPVVAQTSSGGVIKNEWPRQWYDDLPGKIIVSHPDTGHGFAQMKGTKLWIKVEATVDGKALEKAKGRYGSHNFRLVDPEGEQFHWARKWGKDREGYQKFYIGNYWDGYNEMWSKNSSFSYTWNLGPGDFSGKYRIRLDDKEWEYSIDVQILDSGSTSAQKWPKLNDEQRKYVQKVQDYLKQRSEELKQTDPKAAETLAYWAKKMESLPFTVKPDPTGFCASLWGKLSGGTPLMSTQGIIWKGITIYENTYNSMVNQISEISTPDKKQREANTAEISSAFIHEMRHVEGQNEYGAYSYEWSMFKALGVEDGSFRYDTVKSQLETVQGCVYDKGTGTWVYPSKQPAGPPPDWTPHKAYD